MRKVRNSIFLSAVLSMALVSCYKDLSTEATFEIPVIDISGPDEILHVSYGHELDVAVEVSQEGRTEEDFTYLWEIDMRPGSNGNRLWLGEESSLKYKVANTPTDSPYILTCTVTDKKTNLSQIKSWKVYVASSLGEGLLVAYTRDGGLTSDLDLVAAKAITYDYASEEPRYTRELYSFANDGDKIEGKINSMSPFVATGDASYSENYIAVGTDRSIFLVDPLTYKVGRKDAEMFNIHETKSYETLRVFNAGSNMIGAVVDNQLFGAFAGISSSYSPANIVESVKHSFTRENMAFAKLQQGGIALFSSEEGKFHYIPAWQISQGAFTAHTFPLSFPLVGAESVGTGCTKGSNSLVLSFVIKSTDAKFHICTIDFYTSFEPAVTEYSLEGDGLEEAVSFAFCDNADIMYYATPEKIYSVILSAGKASVTPLSWTPDSSDEKICSIEQYSQAWVGTHNYSIGDYDFPLSTNRLQMIITTYNEKTGEGKIYLRPFNVSTGKFTFKSNGTFGGFGKITAITPTLR